MTAAQQSDSSVALQSRGEKKIQISASAAPLFLFQHPTTTANKTGSGSRIAVGPSHVESRRKKSSTLAAATAWRTDSVTSVGIEKKTHWIDGRTHTHTHTLLPSRERKIFHRRFCGHWTGSQHDTRTLTEHSQRGRHFNTKFEPESRTFQPEIHGVAGVTFILEARKNPDSTSDGYSAIDFKRGVAKMCVF